MIAHGNLCALNALDDAAHVFASTHAHDVASRTFGADRHVWTADQPRATVADAKAWLASLKRAGLLCSATVPKLPRAFARPTLICEWDLTTAPRLDLSVLPSIGGGGKSRQVCERRVYFLPAKRQAVHELIAAHAQTIKEDPLAARGWVWTPLTVALQGTEFFCSVREELSRLHLVGRNTVQLPHAEAPHFRLDYAGGSPRGRVPYPDLFSPLVGATPAAVIFASPQDASCLQKVLRRARRRSASATTQILTAYLETRFATLVQLPEYRRWLLYV
jgi:hypothetical protein